MEAKPQILDRESLAAQEMSGDEFMRFAEGREDLRAHLGRFEAKTANGLVYLCDPLKPVLAPGELAVYPHHDEATDLLLLANSLGERFDFAVDPFGGGGHSMLPILKHGIAGRGVSHDINPRAVLLAQANAGVNGFEGQVQLLQGDTRVGLPQFARGEGERVLFIANPPFALKSKGGLDPMRDGGENGLDLTLAYLGHVARCMEVGDCVIGVAYSRLNSAASVVELEREVRRLVGDDFDFEIEIVGESTLWRNYRGVKEEPNPMFVTRMFTKAHPDDAEALYQYCEAQHMHLEQGWDQIGYFRYVMRRR